MIQIWTVYFLAKFKFINKFLYEYFTRMQRIFVHFTDSCLHHVTLHNHSSFELKEHWHSSIISMKSAHGRYVAHAHKHTSYNVYFL